MGSQSVGHNWATLTSLSHLYMTTGKTIDLIICTFVGKWMSLLFNALSRFVISFLPMSKHLWIFGCSIHLQWFWSPRKQDLIWAYFLKISTNCSLEKPSWLLLYLHGARGGIPGVPLMCEYSLPWYSALHYRICVLEWQEGIFPKHSAKAGTILGTDRLYSCWDVCQRKERLIQQTYVEDLSYVKIRAQDPFVNKWQELSSWRVRFI